MQVLECSTAIVEVVASPGVMSLKSGPNTVRATVRSELTANVLFKLVIERTERDTAMRSRPNGWTEPDYAAPVVR